MGLFDGPEELERKANLKKMEDKRVAFAQRLAREGFAPERMLFSQNDNGGFTGLARYNGQYWVVVSPGFGADDDYVLERFDTLNYRTSEVHVKSEGMGGIFGFGKKAEIGREYFIALPGGDEAKLSFVCGRNNWMDVALNKNPLLKTQRRRGDANLVWDMNPLDRTQVERVLATVETFFAEK